MTKKEAMRMQNALGISGRARGIDHHGRVFRSGLDGPVAGLLSLNGAPKPFGRAAGPIAQVDHIQIRQIWLNFTNLWKLRLLADQQFCTTVFQTKAQRLGAKQHEER